MKDVPVFAFNIYFFMMAKYNYVKCCYISASQFEKKFAKVMLGLGRVSLQAFLYFKDL